MNTSIRRNLTLIVPIVVLTLLPLLSPKFADAAVSCSPINDACRSEYETWLTRCENGAQAQTAQGCRSTIPSVEEWARRTPERRDALLASALRDVAPGTVINGCESALRVWTQPIRCLVAPILSSLGGFLLGISGQLLSLVGYLFDVLVLKLVVSFGETIKTLKIIDGIHAGWTILRDISNIAIIGMFTFIAISIIIGNHTFGEKKLVARVLIVAILINFSLLFAQMAIDASNFIAWQVYKKMAPSDSQNNGLSRSYLSQGTGANISGKFLAIAGATTILKSMETAQNVATESINRAESNSRSAWYDPRNSLLGAAKGVFYSLFGSILLLLAAGILLYGCYLIAARAILFIFLMIVSALAFASHLLPDHGSPIKYGWKEWWESLINASLFGPLLMLLLYISLVIITKVPGTTGTRPALGELLNSPSQIAQGDSWSVIVIFILGIGMLYVSFKVADSFAGKIAGFSTASMLTGAPVVGAARLTGLMGRSSFGRWSASKHEELSKKEHKTFRDQLALRALNLARKSTFDPSKQSQIGGALSKLNAPKFGTDWGKGGYVGVKKRQTEHAVHVAAENSEKPSAAADRAEAETRKKIMERIAGELEKTRTEIKEGNRAVLETARGAAKDQQIIAREAQKETEAAATPTKSGAPRQAGAEEINREATAQHARSEERQRVQGEMASRIGRAQAEAVEKAARQTLGNTAGNIAAATQAINDEGTNALERRAEALEKLLHALDPHHGAPLNNLPDEHKQEIQLARNSAHEAAHHAEEAFAKSVASWTPGMLFGDRRAVEGIEGALKAHTKEGQWKDVIAGIKKEIEGAGGHGGGGSGHGPTEVKVVNDKKNPVATTSAGDSHGHG